MPTQFLMVNFDQRYLIIEKTLMNKQELVDAVAAQTGANKALISEVIDEVPVSYTHLTLPTKA